MKQQCLLVTGRRELQTVRRNRSDITVPVISIYLHDLYSAVYGVEALGRSLTVSAHSSIDKIGYPTI